MVNISMPNSPKELVNEGSLVANTGMNYLHIPVSWGFPTLEQFKLFSSVLDNLVGQKIWVHCVSHVASSYFWNMYLYSKGDISEQEAMSRMEALMSLNEVWLDFFEQVKSLEKEVVA